MKEYYGNNVKNYKQPADKFVRLFPAIERLLDSLALDLEDGGSSATSSGDVGSDVSIVHSSVLDLGCGDGILYPIFKSRKYSYLGVDVSQDMINQAKEKNPSGDFVVGSAQNVSSVVDKKFDLVIANMLFPSIGTKEIFGSIFREVSKVLNTKGYFMATIMNPCFDGYMQKMLFNREDIQTEFTGYYTSPQKYVVNRVIEGTPFTFEDFHWQLSDYMQSAEDVGLFLHKLEECKPIEDATEIGGPSLEKMLRLPNYMVLLFRNF